MGDTEGAAVTLVECVYRLGHCSEHLQSWRLWPWCSETFPLPCAALPAPLPRSGTRKGTGGLQASWDKPGLWGAQRNGAELSPVSREWGTRAPQLCRLLGLPRLSHKEVCFGFRGVLRSGEAVEQQPIFSTVRTPWKGGVLLQPHRLPAAL